MADSKKDQTKKTVKKRGGKQEETIADDLQAPEQPTTSSGINYSKVPRSRIGYISMMHAYLAMMHVLESQHEDSPMIPVPQFINAPDESLDGQKLDVLEERIANIEKRMRMTSRRVNESKAAQMILQNRINELETSIRKSEEINVVRKLLNVIPTEKDLLVLEKMKEMESKRQDLKRQLRNKELENKVLSQTMGRAEAIITDTSVITKPKRLVIIEDEPLYGESLSKLKYEHKPVKYRGNYGDYMPYRAFPKVSHGPYLEDLERLGDKAKGAQVQFKRPPIPETNEKKIHVDELMYIPEDEYKYIIGDDDNTNEEIEDEEEETSQITDEEKETSHIPDEEAGTSYQPDE